MILTYKIKHHRDFSDELLKAKRVAEYVLAQKSQSAKFSSLDVKKFGLKSVFLNQIIRKYGRNKKIKRLKSVILSHPNQGIKYNEQEQTIYVPPLKPGVKHKIPVIFENINQIEMDYEYLYVAVIVSENSEYKTDKWIRVDRNTT